MELEIKDYQILRRLGHGKFGEVFLAKPVDSDFNVAIKVLRKKDIVDEHDQRRIRTEMGILRQT